ncbi:ATP-binding protein [Imhoffiella purpurea]|uniref:DNA replication protein DnaC, putative n=1 Tax=Imhoffiella purpurea TaxID=1249627 RepID=W9VAG3_9GAMM|nr:ATP-binding protein [Imhoffiella purpurea]EXJ13881.1 DNA replication protein DnaC, putative [Imhoffiella purpurea]
MTLEQLNATGRAEVVELARERAIHRQRRLELALGRSGIPRRFLGRDFDGYQAKLPDQRHALETCRRYADGFARVLDGGYSLVLAGNPGTGKTHLACAVLAAVIRSGHTGLFITISEALRMIRATYSPRAERTEEEAFAMLVQPNLLVLDEVGVSIGDGEKRRALLFDVINGRYAAQRPTILIGNLDVDGMKDYLGARIMDRVLETGSALVPFTWSSYRTATGNRPEAS